MIRKYICIVPFPNVDAFKVNDIIEIEKLEGGDYVIDGAIRTDRESVYKHFKIAPHLPNFVHAPFSHSKMETWVSCPKKFEWNYIIKPPRTEVPSPILEKGTLFHGILEFDMVNKLDEFELPDTFKALSKKDAESIIGQALDFAETSANYLWIKTLKGIKIPEQEMFLGPDLTPVETLDVALVRGFIDLLIYDEESGACYIFDWKTGGKSKEDLKKWPKPKDQLELYAIWANQALGATYIETAFVYVEHDHMAKYVFEEKDIKILKNKFKDKINNIENDKKFEKNLSQLCAWCDFRESCLGIDNTRDPRTITKDEIMAAGKGLPKENKSNNKNASFLNKIRSKAQS